ncbi:LuxR C-terminal-related transcriptional regulator [Streptomyces hirsutus]|uniref:LuxR C-terminal-related transcriptional regulator n=1 Tax=Streptomyces hirsutus TaxID=35620 RepID=A0ABZ1GP36_9ACTN|nr:LuxR C-terminal-related transcriptional regulator [Streptomyces hirsutus]WSD07869.1 LuxR C-terminal-related transcriptional regulator [Streptomyces hirsutus]
MTAKTHDHGREELCGAGVELYARSLREGHVRAQEARAAPCLVDFGLLHPAVDDLNRLEPVEPTVALHGMLRACEARIADERRREERLAETFQPLMRIGRLRATGADTPMIRVLSGSERINKALFEALAEGTDELLCIQPHRNHYSSGRGVTAQTLALERDQAFLDRGGRIRTLYPHSRRHVLMVIARYEQLRGDAEARTLDEVTDRLIIVDRAVAFVPSDRDGRVALEIRHPTIVGYLATAFDRFWRPATPMHPQAVRRPTLNGVTPRQRAIAALLVKGHTDAVIADRLGMNVRTARVHIAKIATTLGSGSRAQLGYLIGQSGILDQES